MNGILLINKPKNMTSRDVVNRICKILNTNKIGHTGTLDPIATGVLVLCIGKYTKLVDLITNLEKEYIATVLIGKETDTLDITGNIINESNQKIDKLKLEYALNSFLGKYNQEVPIYSAVKVNGKKLYDYARNNEDVVLPKKEVEIKNIQLIDYKETEFSFKVKVSKGTYIRSLIKDISNYTKIPMCMKELVRVKQGNFKLEDCFNIENVQNNDYKLLEIKDVLNYPIVKIDSADLEFKIKNGAIIDNVFNKDIIMFELNNEIIAIYKKYSKDKNKLKPYRMFL